MSISHSSSGIPRKPSELERQLIFYCDKAKSIQEPELLHRPECIKQNNGWARQTHSAKMSEREMIRHTVHFLWRGWSLQQDMTNSIFLTTCFQPKIFFSMWGKALHVELPAAKLIIMFTWSYSKSKIKTRHRSVNQVQHECPFMAIRGVWNNVHNVLDLAPFLPNFTTNI